MLALPTLDHETRLLVSAHLARAQIFKCLGYGSERMVRGQTYASSMSVEVPAVTAFGDRLAAQGWVTDLWVAGSLATGDYVPGVNDLDLVALVGGRVNQSR